MDGYAAESAIIGGELLTEKDIKQTKDISIECTDENVDIQRICWYFTATGWCAVLKAVKKMKKLGVLCPVCRGDLEGEQVGCDSCLEWLYFSCAGINKTPKSKKWFCTNCYNSH